MSFVRLQGEGEAMDIPVNAEVVCADGPCGRSTYIVINPATWQVTHLVVKEKGFPSVERLVSLDQVAETDSHLVRLRCTRKELGDMDGTFFSSVFGLMSDSGWRE
jgi:hypothetical protein